MFVELLGCLEDDVVVVGIGHGVEELHFSLFKPLLSLLASELAVIIFEFLAFFQRLTTPKVLALTDHLQVRWAVIHRVTIDVVHYPVAAVGDGKARHALHRQLRAAKSKILPLVPNIDAQSLSSNMTSIEAPYGGM